MNRFLGFRRYGLVSCVLLASLSYATGDNALRVEIGQTRSPQNARELVDASARHIFKKMNALLSPAQRQAKRPFVVSLRTVLTKNGKDLGPSVHRLMPGSGLTLSFDSTGSTAYATDYQAFLTNVLAAAKPLMDDLYGMPAAGGTVRVQNFDPAGDTHATLFGGYYTAAGTTGGPEIHFPQISNPEAAATGFIHCLLLAYRGANGYTYDAWQEALARAVTMEVVRGGGLPSGVDLAAAKQYLLDQYDAGPAYSWQNVRAMSANPFLAANLRNSTVPETGSTGGIFLLRYAMAGAAFDKVLAHYPHFARDLNMTVDADPTLASSPTRLRAASEQVLNNVGTISPLIEGFSFTQWALRQHILNTNTAAGPYVCVAPTPLTSGLSGPDFGVFSLQVYAFSTGASGNEALASGTLYPIFWDPTFLRLHPSAQEDTLILNQGSGNVAPNFADSFGGANYRVAVDIANRDSNHRLYLPAGAVLRAGGTVANNLYGTVSGVNLQAGDTLAAVVTGNGLSLNLPVTNYAFGGLLTDTQVANARELKFELVRTRAGAGTTLYTKFVNRGSDGPLYVHLGADEEGSFNGPTVPAGMSMVGLPLEPFEPSLLNVLGLAGNLLARYDSASSAYLLGANVEAATAGHGYFVNNFSGASSATYTGRTFANTPASVALNPGWNLVACPLPENRPFSAIQVVHAADDPISWDAANGTSIGIDIFEFKQGPNDPSLGSPQTGSFVAATQFEAGKAYFVRALQSEGATLLFTPSSAGTPAVSHQAAALQATTGVKLTLTGSANRVNAYLGVDSAASAKLDLKKDSLLPPSLGGLAIAATDKGANLYRQVQAEREFNVQLSGLVVGQYYNLQLSPWGHASRARVTLGGSSQTARLPRTIVFRATTTTLQVKVQVLR